MAPCARNLTTWPRGHRLTTRGWAPSATTARLSGVAMIQCPRRSPVKDRSQVVDSKMGTPLSCWFSSSSLTSHGTVSWSIERDGLSSRVGLFVLTKLSSSGVVVIDSYRHPEDMPRPLATLSSGDPRGSRRQTSAPRLSF